VRHDRLLQAIRAPRARLPVSRRRFIRTGLGAVAAGAVVGRQLLRPSVAQAAGIDPIPVPGSPNLAPFNVWAPIFVDSIDAEPATITTGPLATSTSDFASLGTERNGVFFPRA
jgi:hypothetical protein